MEGEGNSINENDKLLALRIDQSNWKDILYKKYLFIIVSDAIVCKQIINFNIETGKFTCHSFNPLYDDYDINIEDVKELFYVKKIVERRISL